MMRPRRVAYVVKTFPKLSESFIANELAELRRRDVEVLVLSLRRPSEELHHEIVDDAGLAERTVYETESFASAIRAFAPDLVHAHFATQPTAAASALAAELGVPFTFTAHHYDIYRKPPEDFAARAARASAVVTVADANVRHIVERFGVPATHLRVIPCGVDTARFRPNGAGVSPPWIVCVARLSPIKNHLVLLEACAALRARGIEFRCVLVGEGRARGEIEAARTRLGLDEHVVLAGAATQTEVLSFWRRAAIAALSSDSEGVPVSLMEAAACGVPVVATAVGGVSELVDDGITGLLVPPGDAAAFAAALEVLLRDPALGRRLGADARRKVEARFSLAGQVDQLLSLWSEVLA
jgi:colanic acid/amylovoran biosynthesis glycosyltransferase